MTTKGFTLVETMVAISILAIALVGPFTAVQSALTSSYVARDRLVASTLAQEGLEYVRSIRDNNYLAGLDWLDGFSSTVQNKNLCFGNDPTGFCTVDARLGDFHDEPTAMRGYSQANVGNIPYLKLNSSGLYSYVDGTDTKFKRTVQINTVPDAAHEIKVTVVVTWQTGLQTYTVQVEDNLYDWL